MACHFIGVNIMNRTLHGCLKVQNFSSHDEKYFTCSLRSLVKYYSLFEEKFRVSTSHVYVISSLYTSHWSVGNSGCIGCFWFMITMLKIHFFPKRYQTGLLECKNSFSHVLKKNKQQWKGGVGYLNEVLLRLQFNPQISF